MNTNLPTHQPVYEFHVAKKIRDKYELDESFFSLSGHVLFANFFQVRLFVQKINEKRPVSEHVSPGEINGAGLLDEIYHIAIRNYIKNSFPNAFTSALSNIEQKLGTGNFDNLLLEFVKVFPPKQVYKNELSAQQYIEGYTDSVANREVVLEELILLHFANRNPAFNKIKELFDENYLEGKKVYKNTISTLRQFFRKDEYKIGIGNTDLFDFLSMPFQKYSSSIWDQLEFIKNEWGIFIDHKLLQKIQSSKDLFTETINFEPNFDGGGGAPTIVPQYKGKKIDAEYLVIGKSSFKYAEDSTQEYDEPEQFTPDTNWMPNLILIAKNTYVWLDQLSKKYGREIKRLDQIPVDELEILKKWNINGLWLIGVWERSSASKKIKHLMGNIDAVSSAYSLYDYQIANDLGGEEAYHFFNELAKEHGIRLASDMVPNHTGIYSDWVLNHPDYYINLDHPPFPNYTFNGENLSDNPDIELRIEDQYWEMKDAAVVFERKDNRTGEKRYYYHGNDGTNMPWNDTAQLNLMKKEVREALIQKIFDVARKFSVIRFDAAMTLAKKHYARLWFPEPGKGGDIPSRADYALTRLQFDELFPKEFWREVVDRINNEMPETLLLAEAFWLMEGYFVRTLGMHRVYNSAFMNMMMNEENEKYRELITNTLEFEPEILKRYVNFMSNPDEETAIEQFGNGDKYFGVLILMNTLPGLPMFAHGQIEGFTEKYGMEYQRAYYDEKPADWLVERHEREVFPILKKRYIFSEVSNFWIYDFIQKNGNLNENVFVYSNQYGIERGLVLYNNSYQATSGTFYYSRQKLNGNSSDESKLHNTNIAVNLDIKSSDFHFYILRDATNGLEYFYNGKELHSSGLYVNLSGYEYRVFLLIEEIFDPSGQAYKFYKSNIGKGNYNVKREVEKLKLASLHDSFVNLFSKSTMTKYFKLQTGEKLKKEELVNLKAQLQSHINKLLDEISDRAIITNDYETLQPKFIKNFTRQLKLVNLLKVIFKKSKIKGDNDIHLLFNKYYKKTEIIILLYNTVLQLKEVFKDEDLINNYISEFMLTKPIKTVLSDHTEKSEELGPQLLLMNILLRVEDKYNLMDEIPLEFLKLRSPKKMYEHILNKNKFFLTQLTHDELIASYLDVNTYEGETYFAKERWDELLDLFTIHSILKYHNLLCKTFDKDIIRNRELVKIVRKIISINSYLKSEGEDSKFFFNKLVKNIGLDKEEISDNKKE